MDQAFIPPNMGIDGKPTAWARLALLKFGWDITADDANRMFYTEPPITDDDLEEAQAQLKEEDSREYLSKFAIRLGELKLATLEPDGQGLQIIRRVLKGLSREQLREVLGLEDK